MIVNVEATEDERDRITALVTHLNAVAGIHNDHGAGVGELLAAAFQFYAGMTMHHIMATGSMDREDDRAKAEATMEAYTREWIAQFDDIHTSATRVYMAVLEKQREASTTQ